MQSLNRSRPSLGHGDDAVPPTLLPGRLPANLTVLVLEGGGDRAAPPSSSSGSGLSAKSFEDEYAYISQSYYADLFFAGQFNDQPWLEFRRLRPAAPAQDI